MDTAKYHFLAWRRLAAELGFELTVQDNERLKGVGRMESLEILLEIGGLAFDDDEMRKMADRKNAWYVEYISKMDESEILPGAREYLRHLKRKGIKTALGSASRNTGLILTRLKIEGLFDAVVDGTRVSRAKPDPEIFLAAARELGLDPGECVVFEDAVSGIQAAKKAGMMAVGIGKAEVFKEADKVVSGLHELIN